MAGGLGMRALVALLAVWVLVAGVAFGWMEDGAKTYIIHMAKSEKPSSFASHEHWYLSTLATVKGNVLRQAASDAVEASEVDEDPLIHVYDTLFHGFAARLTDAQAAALEQVPGFVGMIPEMVRQVHTTHTPEFIGLNTTWGLWPKGDYGEDVIIGVLDTGVWPESKSFSDHKMGPVPERWKGTCVSGTNFDASVCNNKLIGATYYVRGYEASHGSVNESLEYKSPRDSEGHGTHTSSTAGGRYVYQASLLGYAPGTARGMAPKARIAMYKICWESGCYDSDILAAFEQAVEDGVDIISLSVGGSVVPYYLDSIAIGAFAAMKKGVVVSASAGNSGPGPRTVQNIAPWLVTVGASTVDRDFPAYAVLGNGVSYKGESLFGGEALASNADYDLVFSGDVGFAQNKTLSNSASLCMPGTLDPEKVKGKVVFCDRGTNARVEKGLTVLDSGGVGLILANQDIDGEGIIADAHVLPTAALGAKAGKLIKKYIASTKNPKATITSGGTVLGYKPAPVVASFSSRGPNPLTPQVLKPDVIGPGVNILAAWTGAVGPTGLAGDPREVEYNVLSGTSMSCPHISGLAALLRGAHPEWSPAAIKSALVTTARITDNESNEIGDEATGQTTDPFSYGAGHVVPQKALDPGLVYDLAEEDYVHFLCALDYSARALQIVTQDPQVSCPKEAPRLEDLNYPTFSAVFDERDTKVLETKFLRTVTNVGTASSSYVVSVTSPGDVKITVSPEKLVFSKLNEKLSFTVTVEAEVIELSPGQSETAFGAISWSDGAHTVRSPIGVTRQAHY